MIISMVLMINKMFSGNFNFKVNYMWKTIRMYLQLNPTPENIMRF